MENNMVKCSYIMNYIEDKNMDEVFDIYFEWVKTLSPFWVKSVTLISNILSLDKTKTEKYIQPINTAFDLMKKWRYNEIKYVQNRRREIDSAISFIRNNALNNKISMYWFAPICRNVASILRGCLYISTHGYSDDQIPEVIAIALYKMAAIRMFFQFDKTDFVYLLPSHASIRNNIDNIHLMHEIAGKRFGIEKQIKLLNEMANKIWEERLNPLELIIPEEIWTTEIKNISKEFYYGNIKSFYDNK
jgi:hypothetical protein